MLFSGTLSAPTAAGAWHREELRDVTTTTLRTKGRCGMVGNRVWMLSGAEERCKVSSPWSPV